MSEQTLPNDGPPIVPIRTLTTEAQIAEDAAVLDVATEAVDGELRGRADAGFTRRKSFVVRALAAADVAALGFAFLIAELLTLDTRHPGAIDARSEVFLFLVTLPLWLAGGRLYGLYGRDGQRWDHSTFDEIVPILHLATLGTWSIFAGTWALGYGVPAVSRFVAFWLLSVSFIVLGRVVARFFCRRSPLYLQNAVIVGAGDVGQLLAWKLLQHREHGINVVGFVDDAPKERRDDLGSLTILGGPERLPQIVRQFDVERVIIAFSNNSHQSLLDLIRSLRDLDVRVDVVPRLFEILGPRVALHGVGGLPLVALANPQLSRAHRLVKRAMDVVLAATAMVILAPVFLAIAVAVKRTSPGGVFFRQTRMGSGDRTFEMLKFRTMVHDADLRKDEFAHLNKHLHAGGDPRMFKIPDDPRITPVGRFLRRYSLDELPQLINVLRGEMTLVGPRPLILDEDQHITEWGRRRLDLKPGMTGTWQVLGRSEIPFAEMIKLDYLYVTNWSPWRDLRLICQTFPAIVRARSIVY